MVVTVYTAKSKLFDKVHAKSVYIPSVNGDMQVLDNHIPVIVALRPGNIVIEKQSGDKIKINVNNGYIQFSKNELVAVIEKMSLTPEELTELENQAEAMRDTTIRKEAPVTETEFRGMKESQEH
jgi:F0F1-type ATP synthase epsilon subunit